MSLMSASSLLRWYACAMLNVAQQVPSTSSASVLLRICNVFLGFRLCGCEWGRASTAAMGLPALSNCEIERRCVVTRGDHGRCGTARGVAITPLGTWCGLRAFTTPVDTWFARIARPNDSARPRYPMSVAGDAGLDILGCGLRACAGGGMEAGSRQSVAGAGHVRGLGRWP